MRGTKAKLKFCPTCGFPWRYPRELSHNCTKHMLKKQDVLDAIEKMDVPQSAKDFLRNDLKI